MEISPLVVFGPQTELPSHECISRLQRDLLSEPSLASFRESVRNLPDLWPVLLEIEPRIEQTNGIEEFKRLGQWLDTGVLPESLAVTNALLSPLSVILHAVQYVKWIGQEDPSRKRIPLHNLEGMCTGFLTAIAASLSNSTEDFSHHASVALRLAACIGAIVDLNGGCADSNETMQAMVVLWDTELERSWLEQAVTSHPKAYISVIKDTTSATVVVPRSEITSITQTLSSQGLKVIPFSLLGRYHHSSNSDVARKMINLAHSRPDLQFPNASTLRTPLRTDGDSRIIDRECVLHDLAIRSLLTEPLNWQAKITAAINQSKDEDRKDLSISVIGLINCLPRRIDGWRVAEKVQISEEMHKFRLHITSHEPSEPGTSRKAATPKINTENNIAIVGMACRFPGAESVEEFWDLLKEGGSMLSVVPEDRFKVDELRRTSRKSNYWGNFLRNADAFDRQFFKISSREATSMDPQQRLLLQVAYEAMQSANYFDGQGKTTDEFGCYIGVGSVDYQDNIYSHQPTAYSAIGSLRAFLSGRISHYFGWSGPSMTYDTACSSSLVALHSACKALLAGECNGALAGGVNVITSPGLYQNLGAASFLSSTGASKAFDAAADGYCRGEGCGLFVLKRLSDAIDSGDPILSIIAGSAINQSDNSVSITVPHSGSQSSLYRKVLSQTGLNPSDISYVEAHGTGTPVGDPIECQSIRNVFGGAYRSENLHIGSVKSNIGHLEAASGAAALVKSVLMIQKKTIPKQANFVSLNPQITPLEPDKMAITTETIAWDSNFRAICINNYGASGTNGALVVCEPPTQNAKLVAYQQTSPSLYKHLMSISANTASSFQTYCSLLLKQALSADAAELGDYAFNLAHQQDCSLKYRKSAMIESMSQLQSLLATWQESNVSQFVQEMKTASRPIVLCFGGHSGQTIGLDKATYESMSLFRFHLDNVCETLNNMNGVSILPHIFSKDPIKDEVTLHCSLFALQYASAMSWIDSGLVVDTVIGHSFGQITALCIAGVLSLKDALIYVSGRAAIFQRKWSSEKGAMIAVRTDPDVVMSLVRDIPEELEIACYNSPKDVIVVGSKTGIKIFELAATGANIQTHILGTERAFHSRFMDDALPDLEKLASGLTFHSPKLHVETCTEDESWPSFNADRLVAHSRQPVYFKDAVQRIQQRLGSCIWLEAGSNSAVTKLNSRCLRDDRSSILDHIILPVDLSSHKSESSLINTTLQLHDAGCHVQYWLYHRRQRNHFKHINLPPYQFDKPRFWLEYKEFSESGDSKKASHEDGKSSGIIRFLEYRDTAADKVAVFGVNIESDSFKAAVSGHAVMGNGLCPASLYIELAAQAAGHMNHDNSTVKSLPQVTDLRILAPLCLDTSRVQLTLTQPRSSGSCWTFSLMSFEGKSGETKHALGTITIQNTDDQYLHARRETLERFVGIGRCNALLDDKLADAMQGSLVYKVFDRVVNYKSYYQGVRQITSKGPETAGIVTMPETSVHIFTETICKPLIMDNFLQVAGIHVNCLREISKDDLYICTFVKEMEMYGTMESRTKKPRSWVVYVYTKQHGEKILESDILAFDQDSGSLSMALHGVKFSRVNIASLARSLSAANLQSSEPIPAVYNADANQAAISFRANKIPIAKPKPVISNLQDTHATPRLSILQVKELLSSLTDIPTGHINDNETLDALGIDSLMITEMTSEIKRAFHLDISPDEIGFRSTVSELSNYLLSKSAPAISSFPPSSPTAASTEPSFVDVSTFLSNFVVDIPAHEIRDECTMDVLGIDSLMETEVLSEIQTVFGISIPSTHFRQLTVANVSEILHPDQKTPTSSPSITRSINTSSSVSVDDTVASTPFSGFGSPFTPATIKGKSAVPTTTAYGPVPVHSVDDIREGFLAVKDGFDEFAVETQFAGFYSNVYPRQLELVIAYISEAFDKMGCPLASIPEGGSFPLIPHVPKHEKLVRQLYNILETAGIITSDGSEENSYKRSAKYIETGSVSESLLTDILNEFPQHAEEHRLLSITGPHLADCLRGTTDAINLIFGSRENRDLLGRVYLNAPMFAAGTKLLCKFLTNVMPLLTSKTGSFDTSRPIRILEIGAGTGGTTKNVISTLKSSGICFEYTFSDISASLVAAAKKTFASCGKQMSYAVLDIEQEEDSGLETMGKKYDIIISTNCIHATKDLTITTANIRKLLDDNGVLCLVELTRNLDWFDLVFGLLEGWWLFNDGRKHALASEMVWRESLLKAGYGHVDWSEGDSVESEVLRLIVAYNSSNSKKLVALPSKSSIVNGHASDDSRYDAFMNESLGKPLPFKERDGPVVLLTGATGNLGTHILQHLLNHNKASRVICLNRPTSQDPTTRQSDALKRRGIHISPECWSNQIQILEGKTANPNLGLEPAIYQYLCKSVTHIVHNAWPMSFRRPLTSFESQFATMRNLQQLARDIRNMNVNTQRTRPRLVFISSIGVVGHHPAIQDQKPVPEKPVPSDGSASLDMGYARAKLRCEQMILQDAAAEGDPSIETCSIRIGQMAGSREHGIWNADEHFPALLKASQAIGALPRLEGTASWLPVDITAAAVSEILLDPRPLHPIYHVENPARQPWNDIITHLIQPIVNGATPVPYNEWLARVSQDKEHDNQAKGLMDFFEQDFVRMDCGGVVLDTSLAQSVSPSLHTATAVDEETISLYVANWKRMGVLK